MSRKIRVWLRIHVVAVLVLISSPAIAIEWIDNAFFPVKNSDALATAFTQTFIPNSDNFGYADVPTSQGRTAPYAYGYIQRRKADLVVIVPGVGGTHKSRMTLRLGELLRDTSGFHFMAVDSLFSESFANLLAPDPFVGMTRDDAEVMYEWLSRAIDDFKRRTGAKVRAIHLVGYSLGALAAGHLKYVDDRKKVIGISRAILANPPIDLRYGVAVVDNFFLSSENRSSDTLNTFLGFPLNVFEQKYKAENKNWEGMDKFIYHFIGKIFHDDLAGVLRLIKGHPVYNRYGTIEVNETFSRYAEAVLTPFARDHRTQPGLPVGDVFDRADLRQIENFLATNSDTFLLHAKGDFLVRPKDWEWVDRTFGDRARVFLYGGHLGYFLTGAGMNAMESILQGR